mmetsp:Transcript_1943/g.4639  ORF Transcript_1943/g.4639 Transcript_1943/m.4639 type:complete len:397 (-) Transcript_1943:41-1231(-)
MIREVGADPAGDFVAEFRALYEAQQAQINALFKASDSQRDRIAALRQCLVHRGLLKEIDFLVQLHRRRFAKSAHNFHSDAHLRDIVGVCEIAHSVVASAGPDSVAALHATSTGTMPVGVGNILESFRNARHKLYICGGVGPDAVLNSTECFDPALGVWEAVQPMTTPRAGPAAGAIAGQLYVCGGFDGVQVLDTVERFDPRTGTWSAVPRMMTPRVGAVAAAIVSQLYVCGGTNGVQYLRSAEKFNPAALNWEAVPAMTVQRSSPAARIVGRQLHVCGGRDGNTRLNSMERFNCSTGSWEILPPMLQRREGPIAATLDGRWEALRPMLTRRMGAVAFVIGGQLYICGGACRGLHHCCDGRCPVSSTERFNVTTSAWEYLPPMCIRRTDAAAAPLAD